MKFLIDFTDNIRFECILIVLNKFRNRYQWPRTPDEARELTTEQFRRLMDGFAIEGTIKEVFTKQPNLENSIVQDKTVS